MAYTPEEIAQMAEMTGWSVESFGGTPAAPVTPTAPVTPVTPTAPAVPEVPVDSTVIEDSEDPVEVIDPDVLDELLRKRRGEVTIFDDFQPWMTPAFLQRSFYEPEPEPVSAPVSAPEPEPAVPGAVPVWENRETWEQMRLLEHLVVNVGRNEVQPLLETPLYQQYQNSMERVRALQDPARVPQGWSRHEELRQRSPAEARMRQAVFDTHPNMPEENLEPYIRNRVENQAVRVLGEMLKGAGFRRGSEADNPRARETYEALQESVDARLRRLTEEATALKKGPQESAFVPAGRQTPEEPESETETPADDSSADPGSMVPIATPVVDGTQSATVTLENHGQRHVFQKDEDGNVHTLLLYTSENPDTPRIVVQQLTEDQKTHLEETPQEIQYMTWETLRENHPDIYEGYFVDAQTPNGKAQFRHVGSGQ